MTATPDVLPTFDFFEIASDPDPYPRFAEWRAQGPLVKGGVGQWGVTRHGEVSALVKDRRLTHEMPRQYTDFLLGAGPSSEFRQNSILMKDGPSHLRLRRLMASAFTPQLVRQMESRVEVLVDRMIDPWLDGESHDLAEELALPLPVAVICDLMGLDPGDQDEVRSYTASIFGRDLAASDVAVNWLRSYMEGVLRQRRADTGGDLLARMLAAGEGEDGFTHQEVVDNAVLLFFGGFETTRHLISSAGVALACDPQQFGRLRSGPDVAALAVEELLRLDSPVRMLSTMTVEPVEIGGRTIRAGQVLYLMLASANRDETVFAHPDRLDVGRSPNPHVSFGGGAHRCLGMHLARLEGLVVLRRLSQRLARLEPAGTPQHSGSLASYTRVPVRAVPA